MGKKSLFTKDELELLLISNSSKEIAVKYNVDPALISYYVKKLGIKIFNLSSEDPLIQWIYDNCFSIRGSLNNKILEDLWWSNRNFIAKKNEIVSRTNWLETNNITQRIYHIVNVVDKITKCKTCGNDTKYLQFKSGYAEYCSNKCVTQNEERNIKIGKNRDMDVIVKKCRTTNLERYGVGFTTQTENFKIKSKQTKFELYGNEFYNGEFSSNESQGELEVLEFLNSFCYTFKKDRLLLKNLEIDAYCEELKIGIEYCGLYWHSEIYKPNSYHADKMKKCNELGIKLITIFEDEWRNRQKQVKQFLKATIGVFDRRIYARKCLFQQIEPNSLFFDDNHIQGRPQRLDSVFGLFYENEMIGCVSYARHHRNNNDLTLNRLAFVDGVQCVGGASKLIKKSLTNVNENVITWSDNRWSDGLIYEKCGFKFDGLLPYDYSYIFKKRRISKQAMQKSQIGCPEEMTEHQFCLDNKIYRIYDCGKKRWKYNKEI